MKISVLTLGCRTNQAESARIERMLNSCGHQTMDFDESADVCIINTCSVTSKADNQSRQLISRALKSNAQVIVTGCYAELNRAFLEKKSDRIRIISNKDKSNIINLISRSSSTIGLTSNNPSRHRPVVKVQDGCNNFCSYCIVPKARGVSKSVRPEAILDEVGQLEMLGFEEVVISGIHLGIYGRDFSPELNLANLLNLLLLKTAIRRIRLSSIELNELTEDLLDIMQDNRICKHLHVPLQSGDDNILIKMNRSYTSDDYMRGMQKILHRFDNIALGTDIIVGFPSEGDMEFSNTLNLINSIDFSYVHVFPYSYRPGTIAANMPNHVDDSTKKSRVKTIREIGSREKALFIEKNIGKYHEIIIESINGGRISGTTSNFIRVQVPMHDSMVPGRLAGIRITGHGKDMACGIPVITV